MTTHHENTYTQKVWIAGWVFVLFVSVILIVRTTFSVFLLVLAALLIALYFRGLSDLIGRHTNWNTSVCLTISTIGTVVFLAGIVFFMGAKIQSQIVELQHTLPSVVGDVRNTLSTNPLFEKLSAPEPSQKLRHVAQSFFSTTFGFMGDLYVILLLGVFFMVSPTLYYKGISSLMPEKSKGVALQTMQKIGMQLRKWLKGKIIAMGIVFGLTAIGLEVLGIPLSFTLAFIAGVLNFIPNFGPLIALVPAVLIAFTQGITTAVAVAVLYIVIQIVESGFITPSIQKKLVHIPPALIVIAQLFMSLLAGVWGVILATPLMLILIVLVQELYLKKQTTSPQTQ